MAGPGKTRSKQVRSEAQAIRRSKMSDKEKCEACGWIVPKIVNQGDTLLVMHHVVPVQCGGGNDDANLVVICPNCHAMAHRVYGVRRGVYLGPVTRGAFIAAIRGYIDDPTGIKRTTNLVSFGLSGGPMKQQNLNGLDEFARVERIDDDYPTWGRKGKDIA